MDDEPVYCELRRFDGRLPSVGDSAVAWYAPHPMTSLAIHAALGMLTVILFFRFNRHLYAAEWEGASVAWLEAMYYALAIGSVCTGWYFDVTYVRTYPAEASWMHFTKMLFTNPAAASIGQDVIVTNRIVPRPGSLDSFRSRSRRRLQLRADIAR